MSEQQDKLLPCPFCGGEALRQHDPGYGWWTTECSACNCLMTEDAIRSAAEADAAWNRRPVRGTTDLEQAVALLRELLDAGDESCRPGSDDVASMIRFGLAVDDARAFLSQQESPKEPGDDALPD